MRAVVVRPVAVAAALVASTYGLVATAPTRAEETARVDAVAAEPVLARARGCGAERLRKPGGGYWRCSFADEFERARLNRRKWTVMRTSASGYQSGWDACFVDSPANVFLRNGALRLRTVQTAPFTCDHASGHDYPSSYTSGSVTTAGKFSQTYGRYEFRVRFPTAKRTGLHSAVWLYPSSHRYGAWPASGEIDVAELFTRYPDRLIPYVHYLKGGVEYHDTNEYCYVRDLGRWHTIVLVWTPNRMTMTYDGKRCLRAVPSDDLAGPAPFDKPFNVVLTQALGVGWNPFRAGYTPLPATMSVDYVRVWR